MAKYKPLKSVKGKKAAAAAPVKGNWKAIPCLVLIISGVALVCLLFYSMMKSSL
jgi:hypothetical protein